MSIFKESKSYRPFSYPWMVDAEKQHAIEAHWHEGQVDLQSDIQQYYSANGLATANQTHKVNKEILDKVLCLFTEMDKAVGEGYTKILPLVKNNECRTLLMTQAAREIRHQRGYALGAETFGFSDSDWVAFSKYVEMQDKIDLMSNDLLNGKDVTDEYRFCVILSQILLGEGIGLFVAFSTLLNYKRFGLIIGFNDINQWSLMDESEHVKNNIRILKEAKKDLTEVEVTSLNRFIIDLNNKYVAAEHAFTDMLYEIGTPEEMPKQSTKDYINYLGELRLYQMELIGEGEVRKNPYEWMEWLLSAPRHSNFFEKKVTDYSHTGLIGEINYSMYTNMLDGFGRVNDDKYKVYGKDGCPYCVKAIELLDSMGADYIYIDTKKDLDGIPFKEYFLDKYKIARTKVPQVFLLDKGVDVYLGGFDDLEEYTRN